MITQSRYKLFKNKHIYNFKRYPVKADIESSTRVDQDYLQNQTIKTLQIKLLLYVHNLQYT